MTLALQKETLQEALDWVMTTYAFDAFSHYLTNQPLHPRQHIQTYGRGHCLDLAVALFSRLKGSSTVVGRIKTGWSIPTHFAVLVSTAVRDYWLDPSIGICTPLVVGAEFYLGAKHNVITQVKPQWFEIKIHGSRQITIAYEPVRDRDLLQHQQNISRTRKDLTLRLGKEQICYLWQQGRFEWGDRLFVLEDLSYSDCKRLSQAFEFDVAELLHAFLACYSRLPEQFWHWKL